MVVSAACMVHCAVLPVAVVALPAVVGRWERVEGPLGWGFLAVAVVVAGVALARGFARHRHRFPLVSGASGLMALAAAERLGESALAAAVALAGGGALLAAHLVNRRLVRAEVACDCPQCRNEGGSRSAR